MTLSKDQLVGQYQVDRLIGEGGLGTVYEAHAIHDETNKVAIKLLLNSVCDQPEIAARFRREASATAALEHPGIVRIYDYVAFDEGPCCLIMEYLDGESLQARLQRPLPLPELLSIFQQIAEALEFAHQYGIVHRDLKTSNVMLVAEPGLPARVRAKVLDFGVAKTSGSAFTEIGTNDGQTILGTPAYMAPEQFITPSQVSGQADVYSLGIMLHYALSGALPFLAEGHSQAQQLLHYFTLHNNSAPPPLPAHTPPALTTLVQRMLAKAPAGRPTMTQVAQALSAFATGDATVLATVPATVLLRASLTNPSAPSLSIKGAARWLLPALVGALFLWGLLTTTLLMRH